MSNLVTVNLLDAVDEIVDNRGRSCPTAEVGTPLIATNCLKPGVREPVFENVRFVTDETMSTWFRGHPEPRDILFVCKGSPGRVAMVPDPVPFCIAQDMVALRADRSVVTPEYLYYRLLNEDVQRAIGNMHVGTLIPHFKKGDFGKLKFTVHQSVAEQRGIAEVLGALDDKIAANRRVGEAIDRFASALFNTVVGPEAVPLRQVAAVNARRVVPQSVGELRYIDISSVAEGSYEYPVLSEWAEAPGRARRGVSPGDTLWSTVRPNRRSHALLLDDAPELVASTGLAVLTPRDVGLAYLYEATKQPGFQQYLENVAEGSAYPAVRADRFLDAPIRWRDAATSARFEQQVAPLRRLQHAAGVESRSLATARDELLPLLMSGKLTVKDAEERAGEVL